MSFSHEASHHTAASILPLLCQVLPAPLCFSVSLSIVFIPSGSSPLSFSYPSYSSFYSPVCLSAQLLSSSRAAASHLSLFLCTCCSAVPHSFTPLTLSISHSQVYFSLSSTIFPPLIPRLFLPVLIKLVEGRNKRATDGCFLGCSSAV